tara:strand:+ start:68 stop:334 length:267 start_codon:yes stop_codon:yes gene_type:complete
MVILIMYIDPMEVYAKSDFAQALSAYSPNDIKNSKNLFFKYKAIKCLEYYHHNVLPILENELIEASLYDLADKLYNTSNKIVLKLKAS